MILIANTRNFTDIVRIFMKTKKYAKKMKDTIKHFKLTKATRRKV